MSKINLTASRIDGFSCPHDKVQVFYWDASTLGLGVRVTQNGVKSFIFQSKLNNKSLRITIGSTSTWTIGAAQIEARRLKVIVDGGQDPRELKANERQAKEEQARNRVIQIERALTEEKRRSITLGEAWNEYIKARRSSKRKGGKIGWSEWHIRDHEQVMSPAGLTKIRGKGVTEGGVLWPLANSKLCELSGKRIAEWLSIETAKRPTRAALAYRLLSVFVNWCDSHDEYKDIIPAGACKTNQVANELPAKKSKAGDSLQREQLGAWFQAVRTLSNPVAAAYLQTLLLTGARRREIAGLKWTDIDFQWNMLTIRDKIDGERTIPLTPYVSSLLKALPRRNAWVFSSPSSKNGQLVEPTPAHKRALIAAGLPESLSLHGLRRSFGSLAEWTETPAGVVAQIMGHKPSAIAEKHYRDRPIDLLRMWHIKIETWVLEQANIDFAPTRANLQLVPCV